MSGLTWGKPVLVKGRAVLYRRTMSYGGTRDQVEWLVKTTGTHGREIGQFSLKRAALAALDCYSNPLMTPQDFC